VSVKEIKKSAENWLFYQYELGVPLFFLEHGVCIWYWLLKYWFYSGNWLTVL